MSERAPLSPQWLRPKPGRPLCLRGLPRALCRGPHCVSSAASQMHPESLLVTSVPSSWDTPSSGHSLKALGPTCVRSSWSWFLKVPPAQRAGLTSLVKTRPPTHPHHSPRGDTFHLSRYALLEAQSRLLKEEIGGELELPHTLAFPWVFPFK